MLPLESDSVFTKIMDKVEKTEVVEAGKTEGKKPKVKAELKNIVMFAH